MRNVIKKIWNNLCSCMIACLAIVCTLCVFAACGGETSESGSSSNQGGSGNSGTSNLPQISFTVSEKNLTIGDEEYLFPVYEKMQGYTLTYQSSNPAVVQVNNDGKISAITEGQSTVSAIYSNGSSKVQADILVKSSFSGYLPELKTMGVDETLTLVLNDTYVINPYVAFNGKTFNDVTVTYAIADNSVAEVNANGEVVAKAKGQTQLVMQGAWRGKDKASAPTMQKTLTLAVIDDVKFYNDGKAIADQAIYTLSEFDGKSYQTTIPCDFKVSVNGVEEEATVVIEKEEILAMQGEYLVANHFGETKVTVQKQVGDQTYSKEFTVTVQRIEKTVENTVPLFSTLDGSWLQLETKQEKTILSFIGEESAAVDAYQNGKPLTISENKVLGVESSSPSSRGTADISVGTENVIYHFHLETLAKAISKAEDLNVFKLEPNTTLNGYYELLCDVDASAFVMVHGEKTGKKVTSDGTTYFAGVFNGAGHVIDGVTLTAEQSFFGVLAATAIVKNVAFTNLNATKAYFFAHGTLDYGLHISNAYVQLSNQTQSPRGLLERMDSNAVFENIVLEYLGENAQANRNYQDRWAWQGLMGGMWRKTVDGKIVAQDSKWSDVIVVSPFVVSFRPDENINGETAAVYGYGANETTDIYGNPIGQINTRPNPNLGNSWWTENYVAAQYTNLYHYTNYSALENENYDYSSFSEDCWVVYNNRIIWKSLFKDSVSAKIYDNAQEYDGAAIATVGKQFKVKAFVNGVEDTNAEIVVSIEDNSYLTWNAFTKSIKVSALPESGVEKVKINVTIKVAGCEITKTLTITVRGLQVPPIHSGGNFNAGENYEGYFGGLKDPIHSGGNFDAGENYGD